MNNKITTTAATINQYAQMLTFVRDNGVIDYVTIQADTVHEFHVHYNRHMDNGRWEIVDPDGNIIAARHVMGAAVIECMKAAKRTNTSDTAVDIKSAMMDVIWNCIICHDMMDHEDFVQEYIDEDWFDVANEDELYEEFCEQRDKFRNDSMTDSEMIEFFTKYNML